MDPAYSRDVPLLMLVTSKIFILLQTLCCGTLPN